MFSCKVSVIMPYPVASFITTSCFNCCIIICVTMMFLWFWAATACTLASNVSETVVTEHDCFEVAENNQKNETRVITITPECMFFVGEPGDTITSISPQNKGNCNQYAVRRIRVNNIGQRRDHFIIMAIARRGARLQFISLPAKTMRIQKHHRIFHHYSNMVTGKHSIHSFVTIADYLFVSTIYDKRQICLNPVQFSLHLNKLSIQIMENDLCIPNDVAPPGQHALDSFQGSDHKWVLVIRYEHKSDVRNAVLLKVEDIFTPDAVSEAVNHDSYKTYSSVLKMKTNHLQCKAKFGGFSAYHLKSTDVIEERRIVSKTLPSRREGYPFTISYQDRFGAEQKSGGLIIFCALFAGGGIYLIAQWYLSNREETKRRQEVENSHSRSKSKTKSNSKM